MKDSGRFITVANILLCFLIIFTSCGEKEVPIVEKNKLKFVFVHNVDGNTMVTNQNIYTNAAGNQYEIREVMYFISEVKLYNEHGTTITIDNWDDIHYIDSNIPSSLEWVAGEDIPNGIYDSITFIFGIKSSKNKLGLFVNPPESNMAWPEILGGGYHYMMLNGFWIDNNNIRKSFNFHLGIGQIYTNDSGQTADITGFVDNSFIVRPLGQPFEVAEKGTTTLKITMNIDSWFTSPHIYDHNKYGGAIMQNQEAMRIGCINGMDAFTLQQ
jgi:hypothetical protein